MDQGQHNSTHDQIEAMLNRAGDLLHELSMLHTEIMIIIMKSLSAETIDCAITVPFYSTSGFTTIAIRQVYFEQDRTQLWVLTADKQRIPFHELMPLIQNLVLNTVYVTSYLELTN